MKDIDQILLNKDVDQSVVSVLESVTKADADRYAEVFFFLGSLTEDPIIKKAVNDLVQRFDKNIAYQDVLSDCLIFKTVDETLTDEGAAFDRIDEQFKQFHSRIAKHTSLLETNNLLTNKIVELGKKLHLFHGMTNEAERCFQLILDENQTHVEAAYSMGRIMELKGANEKAYSMYELTLRNHPDHIFANLQMGILCYKVRDDHHLAIQFLNKVISLEPYRTEIYPHLAQAYVGLDQIDRAIQVVESGLAIHPHNERGLELLGLIYWQHKNEVEKAKAIFEKGLDHAIHGDSSILLFRLGELNLDEFNDVDLATVYFEKAFKGRSNDKVILFRLLEIYLDHKQNTHRADELYKSFIDQHDDIEVLVKYATFCRSFFNDLEKALSLVERALSINPHSAEALSLLKVLKEEQDYQEILDLFEEDSLDDDDDEFVGGDALGDND